MLRVVLLGSLCVFALTGCLASNRLVSAAGKGQNQLVQQYLDQGDDPNGTDTGASAINHIATGCSCDTLKRALAKGANPNLSGPVTPTPLLHIAMTARTQEEIIKEREEYNAKVRTNMKTEEAAKPYLLPTDPAEICSRYDSVKLLIEGGADPNAWDMGTKNFTPILLAAKHGKHDVVQALVDSKKADTEVHYLQGMSEGAAIGRRLEWKNAALASLPDHPTPLIFAVLNNDAKMVEILLKGGADPSRPMRVEGSDYVANTKFQGAASPLDVANAKGYQDIAKLISDAGGVAYGNAP